MKRDRRQQILWELIDQMFTTVEYWDERDLRCGNLNNEEHVYLMKTISTFAKKVKVTNHIYVK